jgi:hypothetical protein
MIERMHFQTVPDFITLPSPQLGYGLDIDRDAPFRVYAIAVFPIGGAVNAGALQMRFTRPDGSWMQRDLMPVNSLVPNFGGFTGGPPAGPNYFLCSPIFPNLVYAAGSSINIDIEQIVPGGGEPTPLAAMVVFIGCKLYRDGAADIYIPPVPKKFTLSPFLGYEVVIPAAQLAIGPVLDVPLDILPDAGFLWQASVFTDTPIDASMTDDGLLINLGVRVKDYAGKYYSNVVGQTNPLAGYVPAAVMFGFLNSQLPGIVYPEIFLPRQGALYFDFAMLDGSTPSTQNAQLSLKGMKVYG